MNPVHHNVRTVLFAPKGCVSLFAADSGGTSDPYVVVRPNRLPKEGSEPHKTTTKKKTLNPTWEDEVLSFAGQWANNEKFIIEIYDWNRFTKNSLIGSCEVNLNDEDLLEKGFPTKGIAVAITRSLGEGKGTIDLEITPVDWELSSSEIEAEKVMSSWPLHSKRVGNSQICFRLPPTLQRRVNTTGFDRDTYECKEGTETDSRLQFSIVVYKESFSEEAQKKQLQAAVQIIPGLTYSDCPTTDTGEKGETTIGGAKAPWVTSHHDFTIMYNLPTKYAQCTTHYFFALDGKFVGLSYTSICNRMKNKMEASLKHHQQQREKVWQYVMQSLSVEHQ